MPTERIDIVVSDRGTRTVRRNIDQIGAAATRSSSTVKLLRRSLGLLGGALIITGAVRTLASFSQEMSTVRAVTEATGDAFQALRDKAKDLGATTRFSATEAAEGMTFLARAGYDAEEVLGSIEGTLQLAQAGALGLGQAADIASNVLQGFRLNVDQTSRVVDVLALAANSSNTNVTQLGDAMKFVAPVAAGVGVSIEEATAAIGVLSNAGLQASMAGTGLRRVLSELESTSPKTAKILNALGLSTDDVRISSVGLTTALTRLKEAGVDTGLALEIFGDRGGPAFEVLSNFIPDVAALNQELNGADGTVERIAKTMDDNLNGALLAVRSAAEDVVIEFGDLGAESSLTGFFRGLADALRFAANNMTDVADAAIILGTGFLALKLPRIIAEFNLLKVAIATNPIGALAVAVSGAAAAFALMQSEIQLADDDTLNLSDAMRGATDVLGNSLVQAVNDLGGSFTSVGEIFDEWLADIGRGLIGLVAAANGTVQAILAAFDDLPSSLGFGEGETVGEAFKRGFTETIVAAVKQQTAPEVFGPPAPPRKERPSPTGLPDDGTGATGLDINGVKDGAAQAEELAAALRTLRDQLDPLGAAQRSVADAQSVLNDAVAAGTLSTDEAARLQAKLAEEYKDALDPLGKVNEELSKERELLSLSSDARKDQTKVMAIEAQLRQQGVTLSREQTAALTEEVSALRMLNEETQLRERVLNDIRGPAEDLADTQKALNDLYAQGAITADEFNRAITENRLTFLRTQTDFQSGVERTLLKTQLEFADYASQIEGVLTGAFNGASDALAEFVSTGKLDIKSLTDTILQEGTKLAAKGFLGNIVSGASGGSGGLGGVIGGLFGGGGGSGVGGGGAGGGSGAAGILGSLGGLFGFESGGSFAVNSATSAGTIPGGTDNRLVAFRARDGEQVTVSKPGADSAGGRGVGTVNITVNTPDANSFRRSQGQILADAQAQLSRANRRNG